MELSTTTGSNLEELQRLHMNNCSNEDMSHISTWSKTGATTIKQVVKEMLARMEKARLEKGIKIDHKDGEHLHKTASREARHWKDLSR